MASMDETARLLQVDLDADLSKSAPPAAVRLLPVPLSAAQIVPGPLVVQLVDCVDVARPAAQQHLQEQRCAAVPEPSPSRMLLLTLTDGQTECRGLELCSIPQLSAALCVPGTKLALQGVPARQGMLLLSPTTTRVLGGRVAALMKQHELMQTNAVLDAERLGKTGSGGPPPFVDLPARSETSALQTVSPVRGLHQEKKLPPGSSAPMRTSAAADAGRAQTKLRSTVQPKREQQQQQETIAEVIDNADDGA